MKKIIICLILIVHSLTFTQNLRVKEGIVNDEVIINTFKTSAFPNGITLVPMEKDRKWEHPINTTEEYSSYIETEKERPKKKYLLLDNSKKENK